MSKNENDLFFKNECSLDDNNIFHIEKHTAPQNNEFLKINPAFNKSNSQKKKTIITKKQIKSNLLNSQPKKVDKTSYHPINSSPNILDKDNLYNLFLLFQYYSLINKDKNNQKIMIPSLLKEQITNSIKNNNLKNNNEIEKGNRINYEENNIREKKNNNCFINYGIINTDSFSDRKFENNNNNNEDENNNKLLIKKKTIIKYPAFVKRHGSIDYSKRDEENNEFQNKNLSTFSNYFDNNSLNKIKLNENNKIGRNSLKNFYLSKNEKLKLDIKKSAKEIKVNTKKSKIKSKSKNKESLLNNKIKELNYEIILFKEKTKKINLLRSEYEKLQLKLNKDIEDFKKEKEEFEKYKSLELEKIQKEKNKYQALNQKNKKDQIKKLNGKINELEKLVKEKDKELLKVIENCNKNHIERTNKNNFNKNIEILTIDKIENSNIKQNNRLKKYITTKSNKPVYNQKSFRYYDDAHFFKNNKNDRPISDFTNNSYNINSIFNSIEKFKTLENNLNLTEKFKTLENNSNTIGKFKTLENNSNSIEKFKTLENNSNTIGKFKTLENNSNSIRNYFNDFNKKQNDYRKNVYLSNSIYNKNNSTGKVCGTFKKINFEHKSNLNFLTHRVNNFEEDDIVFANVNNTKSYRENKRYKKDNELNISEGFDLENDEKININNNNEKNNDIEINDENKINSKKIIDNNNSDLLFFPQNLIKEISDVNKINTISNTQNNWSQNNQKEKLKIKLNINKNVIKEKIFKKEKPQYSERNSCSLQTFKKVKLGIKPNIKNLITSFNNFSDPNKYFSVKSSPKKSPIYNIKKIIKKIQIKPKINKFKSDINENYDFIIPEKYLIKTYKLLNRFKSKDKIIKLYDNNKKEILFKDGIKKEVFDDGFVIINFPNGDKEINFKEGKKVYFFNETKTVQTTYKDGTSVLKFNNNKIEKHFVDGSKYIIFPNGKKQYISKYGIEENNTVNEDKKLGEIFLRRGNFDVSELLDQCDPDGKDKEVCLSFIDIDQDDENALNKNY